MTFIGVAKDRIAGRAIIGSALDNLTKGASGQAVQNMNVMLGLPEATGSIRSRCFRDVRRACRAGWIGSVHNTATGSSFPQRAG